MLEKPWWGEFSLEEGQNLCWSASERKIVIERQAREWKTWDVRTEDEYECAIIQTEYKNTELLDDLTLDKTCIGRYLQQVTSDTISVLPALADRSIVARPSVPLRVLAGECAQFYVSTPLWLSAKIQSKGDVLLDVPFWRPSDSWFGSSTLSGELCYAKYTDARVMLQSLEQRHHRAITPISVTNKHKDAIIIERLNVPVPLLNLYSDEANQLWTEAISVAHDTDNETALLELGKEPPSEASNPVPVNTPRVEAEKRTLIRSISSLFA